MANTLVEQDVVDYLIAQGVGSVVRAGHLPTSPVRIIVVNGYPGGPTERGFGSAPRLEHAKVQLRARAETRQQAMDDIDAAQTAMLGIELTTINTRLYHLATPHGVPFEGAPDENGKPTFTLNVAVDREV